MGHLMFAGVFVFFILLIVGKIYFSYIYAVKKRDAEDADEIMSVEIDEQEKRFYVHKGITLFGGFLVLLAPFFLMHLFDLLKNEPQSADALWMLIDLLISAFFVFILLFLTGLRSYVHINKEGFEYRGPFRTTSCPKEKIEHVYRTENFFFIKLKDRRMPMTIETIYNDKDCLYRMLYKLSKKQ